MASEIGKGSLEIAGKRVPFTIKADGAFTAEGFGKWFRATTLVELRQKLVKAAQRAKARIAVRYFSQGQHRTCTGRHLSSGKWLVRTDGESGTEQETSLPFDALRPLASEEIEERKALVAALQAARSALVEWDKPRHLDVEKAVEQALLDAIAAMPVQPAEEEPTKSA